MTNLSHLYDGARIGAIVSPDPSAAILARLPSIAAGDVKVFARFAPRYQLDPVPIDDCVLHN